MPEPRERRTAKPGRRPQAPARIAQDLRPIPRYIEFTHTNGGEPTHLPTLDELRERKRQMDEAERERVAAEEREREEERAKKAREDEDDELKKVERFRNDRYAVKLLRQDVNSWGGAAPDELDPLG